MMQGHKNLTPIRKSNYHHHHQKELIKILQCNPKETYNKSLKMFVKKVEKELLDPENVKNIRQNLTGDERNVLTEIKKWE